VLKSGVAQSNPTSRSRLWTNQLSGEVACQTGPSASDRSK
jgi:hypothetical protein